MVFFSAFVIRGINIPLVVLLTSSKALVLAVLPSVFIAKDCEKELYRQNVKNNTAANVILNFIGMEFQQS